MANKASSTSGRASADGLTRYQVARQLGVGVTTVLRMCQRGELHPKPGPNGVPRYDPAEVVRVAASRMDPGRRTAGDTAAAAFSMFDNGAELKDIVVALRLAPEDILRLYKYWQRSLDDGLLESELPGGGASLLDEDPRADESFARAMAAASGLADPMSAPRPTTNSRSRNHGCP